MLITNTAMNKGEVDESVLLTHGRGKFGPSTVLHKPT